MLNYIQSMAVKSKECAPEIAAAPSGLKNRALLEIAHSLRRSKAEIAAANELDLKAAKARGMSESLQDRLRLTEARIEGIAGGCEKVAALEDPVGEVIGGRTLPSGMTLRKVRVPLGVIGIIYEARPNVTVDAAALCIKSGNAVILRGGKEAINSNKCLMDIMRRAVARAGLPQDILQLVEDTDRGIALEMMQANGYIDVLIPRGGSRLIQTVVQNATVPVIETGTGNCHAYVDASADLRMAVDIVDNGKTQRPSVCNALETCLVHRSVAEDFLPMLKAKLDEHNVEIRGCELTAMILGEENVTPATEEDYATEFGDYIIAVKVVDSLGEAIEHIAKYSTGHSEVIITESLFSAEQFQKRVDSAAVYVNCSTRFTDGEEFGLGAEIGISTQKLHTRGPMGLRELTTVKWLINGNGQIRS